MRARTSVPGRPYGTDGSDFSYRMVVDPRYTKVAEGKSRLKLLIITQVVVQVIGVICTILLPRNEEPLDSLDTYSTISVFFSLLIGELGRKRSKANLLKLYMLGSSAATLISVVRIARSNILLTVLQGPSGWETKRFELIDGGHVLLGLLLEILAVVTTMSLIQNMKPPKRA